jgi:exodeoxyribonuclease VII large subunit
LYANILRPAGRGQLYAQFEELKARLEAAGLFAAERKRPIPVAPARVAIVTSADAAALRDVLRVMSARWPLGEAIVFPTLVQGSEAPAQIAQAIAAANRYSQQVAPFGVLLLVRGGGSIEDLWAFNDERVAAAVAASDLPVVCGVGHETDFTIADFVADLRAPTPSAAAMAITPDRAEVLAQLGATQRRLAQDALATLAGEQRNLARQATRLERLHPRRQLDTQLQRLDERTRRLHLAMNRRRERLAERRTNAILRLESLNPARVLQRGYSIVQRQNGEVVMGPAGAAAGEQLQVRAAGGDYVVTKVS